MRSSRDAIGAIATVTAGGRQRRQWLAAGDGYEASNERRLVFGLGGETKIEKLHVHWPSGLEQEFRDLAADQELILVEGSSRAVALPRGL
ncbi:MAG TPA: ASPIC/UnbV domain-containing protein [Pirellulales bacterium]|nr:ASPIC/UnbV domain-containing protein [Pirellulales bacterium]